MTDAPADEGAGDLTAGRLVPLLGDRPLRAYPALLSTEATAQAWARAGGPTGAVVVAEYQASPRGRGGLPWTTPSKRSLGFSVLVRPELAPERAGWLYLATAVALAEVFDAASVAWPDTVTRGGGDVQVAVQTEEGGRGLAALAWAVVSVLVPAVAPPRGPLLARMVTAVEAGLATPAGAVLERARAICATLGHRVKARIIPMGPRGVVVEGLAADLDEGGSLVVETDRGRRQPVRPQDVGLLEVEEPATGEIREIRAQ